MSFRSFFQPRAVQSSVAVARLRPSLVRPSRILALTALAASISACNTIPKANNTPVLAQPNVPINQTYEAYDAKTVSTGAQPSIAATRWQSFYSDERLKALIAMGLDNNKDFENARLAIQKARAQYQITDINDLPTINGTAGYTRQGQNSSSNSNYNVNLGLASYELDFWGRIASLKDQALQNFLATTAAKDATQISLISNIAQSYANLSYGAAQLQLAQATVKSREQSLFIANERFKAGVDAKLPSLQASAALDNAKLSVLSAQSTVLTARNALQFLVGTPIPDELLPAPQVSNIASESIFNAGLPSELLRYRPDILQAEYSLKAAGANIEAARAAYYPTISLASSVGISSSSLSDLVSSNAVGWSFGPNLSIPIFDAGRLDANYEVAQIEQKQALSSYEKAIQSAFREVSDVLATRSTLDERLKAQYRLQDNYEQTFNIANARFKAGLDNYLDVLDAQRSLFATQQGILDLELQKLISQIELYQALGGGANLDIPTAIPTPQYTNLANLHTAATSSETKAAEAVKAASSARVVSVPEAIAIKSDTPVTEVSFDPEQAVDINNDGNADAAVGTLTKTTTQP
ncbi:efflux transporter outer membrane subunit [Psychrobacter aestuarii]|uniref:Multidrug efflux RND transporter outer membrane channel subunit AdeK n=1 Tax=Psychrobacter aestuarii TaxID=556327 RepID=A0ABP3FRF3_9GAMM|nr:efflux transporter outer membrane subunit [Psychrobacter aestuarii]